MSDFIPWDLDDPERLLAALTALEPPIDDSRVRDWYRGCRRSMRRYSYPRSAFPWDSTSHRHTSSSASTSTWTLNSTSTSISTRASDPWGLHTAHGQMTHQLSTTPRRPPIDVSALQRRYQHPVWLQTEQSDLVGGLIFLDTGATVNLISTKKAEELGLERDAIRNDERIALTPFYTAATGRSELTATEKVFVDWQFVNSRQTYTTEFWILDMPRFDVLLGGPEIAFHELLKPGEVLGGILRSLGSS